ncbi:MAG: PLP-dependent aspartate aminotransferase family protein [Gammaproteobacteria bacterium]|nr:PLP-dependent aspartate aminotransferase family protein [Gammaproteobacteria bacterium]
MSGSRKKFDTLCIHAGQTTDPATGAVMPPIYTSTTFEHEAFGQAGEYAYSRGANPTRGALERCVAELEGGVRGFAYASGMAATAAVLELLEAGSHVIAQQAIYGGTLRLFNQVRRHSAGLDFTFVDFFDLQRVESLLRPETRLIWVETPTNPLLDVVDLTAVAELAHRHDVLVCVDNTFASPILQRPLERACDIVMHSSTKYLGGHSDVLGGINVVADPELGRQIAAITSGVGSVAGPFDAYLVLRGIKTLALRMERHESNAQAVAAWLETRECVQSVRYPGLPSHPQHALARSQMDGFGGVVSFQLDGDLKAVGEVLEKLQVFTMAESLGGVESLVGHPATMSHSNIPAEQRRELGINDNLIRLSVGIEHVDDLIADLDQALAR